MFKIYALVGLLALFSCCEGIMIDQYQSSGTGYFPQPIPEPYPRQVCPYGGSLVCLSMPISPLLTPQPLPVPMPLPRPYPWGMSNFIRKLGDQPEADGHKM